MPFWIPFLVALGVSLGLYVAGQLFIRSSKDDGRRPDEIEFPTVDEARSIPVVWGDVLITAPQVIWFGDFRSVGIYRDIRTGLFSGDTVTLAYQYYVGMALALCWGPLDDIDQIYIEEKLVWGGSYQFNFGTTNIAINAAPYTPNVPGPLQKGIVVDAVNLWGGIQLDNAGGEGGVYYRIIPYMGTSNQEADPYLTQVGGDYITYDEEGNEVTMSYNKPLLEKIAYRDVAYLVFQGPSAAFNGFSGYVGIIADVKPMSFRVRRLPTGPNATTALYKDVIGSANPVNCLYELYTNTKWSPGIDPSLIDIPSWQAAAQTCFNEDLGISHQWQVADEFNSLADQLLRTMDAVIYSDLATGKIVLRLIRADYNILTIPTLEPSDIITMEELSRESPLNVINQVYVEFNDRLNKYKRRTTAPAQDLAGQRLTGRVNPLTVYYPVSDAEVAQRLAFRDLRANSAQLYSGSVLISRTTGPWYPGDTFKLNWPAYNLSNVVMRVAAVDYGELEDNRVRLKFIQDVFALSSPVYNPPLPTAWTPVQVAAVIPPLHQIFKVEKPWEMSGENLGLMYLIGRPNNSQLNYDLYTTVYTGIVPSNKRVSRDVAPTSPNSHFTPYGFLTVDCGTSGLDSGGSDGGFIRVSYRTGIDLDRLINCELQDVQNGFNLALILDADGNFEWIGFETIEDDLNPILYDPSLVLRRCWRGLFNTTPKPHSQGARIWFPPYGQSSTIGKLSTGQVVLAGIQVHSLGGSLYYTPPVINPPAGSLAKYRHTMAGTALLRYVPRDVKINGVPLTNASRHNVVAGVNGDATITWKRQRRVDVPVGNVMFQSSPEVGNLVNDGPFTINIYKISDGSLAKQFTILNPTQNSAVWTAAEKTAAGLANPISSNGVIIELPGPNLASSWRSSPLFWD